MPNIENINVAGFDDLNPSNFEEVFAKQATTVSKKKVNYIDKKVLHEAFVKYKEQKLKWVAAGKEGNPPLSDDIGLAILQICKKLGGYHKFAGYTKDWKEEMVDDAIESCVRYCHNYDPEKSQNPFAYLTMIAYNAFLQRIKKEKVGVYIKYKMFDKAGGFQAIRDNSDGDEDSNSNMNELNEVYRGYLDYIGAFEKKAFSEPAEPKPESMEGKLEF